MKTRIKRISLALLALLIIATAAFVIWAENPLKAMPEALAALESDADVRVTTDGWMVFTPSEMVAPTGVIIYPGGRVDPRAYAPLAKEIARTGGLARRHLSLRHLALAQFARSQRG